jgi:hypothetical protein
MVSIVFTFNILFCVASVIFIFSGIIACMFIFSRIVRLNCVLEQEEKESLWLTVRLERGGAGVRCGKHR